MPERIKRLKHSFDEITSQHSTNWQLVLFWIIVFELVASIFEYVFIDSSSKLSVHIPHTLFTELTIASIVTLFIWFCIYNIIFESRINILRLSFFAIVGLYFVVTSDFTLAFLMQNLNPLHFFDYDFGVVFFIELFFKLLITYLIYQLIVSIIKRD